MDVKAKIQIWVNFRPQKAMLDSQESVNNHKKQIQALLIQLWVDKIQIEKDQATLKKKEADISARMVALATREEVHFSGFLSFVNIRIVYLYPLNQW